MIIPCCSLASLLCKMLQCPKAFAEETALPNSSSKKMQLELLQLWLCHAVSCHFSLCLCHVLSCYFMLLHAIFIPLHAMSCYVMLCHSIACYCMLFPHGRMSCCFMPFHAISRYLYAMLCDAILFQCHAVVMLFHAISLSCYFMLQVSQVLRCFQSKP